MMKNITDFYKLAAKAIENSTAENKARAAPPRARTALARFAHVVSAAALSARR